MAVGNRPNMNAFDFAQDAQDFKTRLWKKLKTRMAMTAVYELEDEDLEWVNAAGLYVHPEDSDERI